MVALEDKVFISPPPISLPSADTVSNSEEIPPPPNTPGGVHQQVRLLIACC